LQSQTPKFLIRTCFHLQGPNWSRLRNAKKKKKISGKCFFELLKTKSLSRFPSI
jgi:hypothetical protein